MLPTQGDKVPNFFWFLIHFILLIVISFKVSESESLKGQNQPIRERRKPAKLNKEDFLFSLSSDDEEKGKNQPVSKQKKNSTKPTASQENQNG